MGMVVVIVATILRLRQIVDQFKEGVRTLTAIKASNGLTAESVDDVIDQLNDLFLDQREIESALTTGNAWGDPCGSRPTIIVPTSSV